MYYILKDTTPTSIAECLLCSPWLYLTLLLLVLGGCFSSAKRTVLLVLHLQLHAAKIKKSPVQANKTVKRIEFSSANNISVMKQEIANTRDKVALHTCSHDSCSYSFLVLRNWSFLTVSTRLLGNETRLCCLFVHHLHPASITKCYTN